MLNGQDSRGRPPLLSPTGPATHSHIDSLIDAIRPAGVAASKDGEDDLLERSVRGNAEMVAGQMNTSDPVMAKLGTEHGVKAAAAYYDLESGKVEFLEGDLPAGAPMLIKVRYSVREMLSWTRWEALLFLSFAFGITALIQFGEMKFLHVPWAPVAVVGTAVAFIVGFQNNAAYGRIWEARKIWGGIVNASRTFGMKVHDMVTNEYAKEPASDEELANHVKTIVYRHVAWMSALRHSMRKQKTWEEFDKHWTNREWSEATCIPERVIPLEEELAKHLTPEEAAEALARSNPSAAILFQQSRHLRRLKERGLVWEFAFLELENLLQELFTLQGKTERIKNFPYPRQYATLSHHFVWVFVALVPFATIPEFAKMGAVLAQHTPWVGKHFIWLAVPFSALISWIFHTMERIGRVGENPFEGSPNDVPISTISRGIEIDLLQMIGEKEIPEQYPTLFRQVQM